MNHSILRWRRLGLLLRARLVFLLRVRCVLLLIVLAQGLVGCTVFTGAKPVMGFEQAIDVYTVDKSPAPTVLMLPGCGGAQDAESAAIMRRKASWLNTHGFNAAVFDFTKMMGVKNACLGQIKKDSLGRSAIDAFRYVASQPYADRNRVILLGWSMGASMALAVVQELQAENEPKIAGVAAYYPGCFAGLKLTTYPTLLLIGLADNVVDPNACLALIEKSSQEHLTYKTYEGAHHGFDVAEYDPPRSKRFFWKKYTSAYDANATADAENTLLNFLRENTSN